MFPAFSAGGDIVDTSPYVCLLNGLEGLRIIAGVEMTLPGSRGSRCMVNGEATTHVLQLSERRTNGHHYSHVGCRAE